MRFRSLLFVPGDRPDRMRKAMVSGADGLILDLEDSVACDAKPSARSHVAEFIEEAGNTLPLFVRINALGRDMLAADIAAAMRGGAFGIVLPKAEGRESLSILDRALAGSDLVILPIVTETPRALFETGHYGGVSRRLFALSWGAEDLSAALGASTARKADGSYRPTYELARSLTLVGAHAAGVPAMETIYPDIADVSGLTAYAARAREDGFSGMTAIHPSQIAPIHAAFRPSDAEVAEARRIVEAFEAGAGAGALRLDGKMIDAPHLAQAKRLLREVEA